MTVPAAFFNHAMGGEGPHRRRAVHGCDYFHGGQSASAPGMVVHLGVGMSRGCLGCDFLASGIKRAVRSDAVIDNGLPKARN